MLLPFTNGLIRTSPFDCEMARLADRHYSRRTVGSPQFANNGRKLVLRNAAGTILWVWMYPDPTLRFDSQVGYNNSLFRNESSRLSSDIILEAERFAVERWGPGRAYTFIDANKIESSNPGYCFKVVGWDHQRDEKGRPVLTKTGKHILEKELL